MMKLYIWNVWVIKFLLICIDLILSLQLWSETHSSVKNSNSVCGQNVDHDREEGAGGPVAWSLSCARSSRLCQWVPAHWSGERRRAISKKRQNISAQVDVLCLLFFRCVARWLHVRNELFWSMVSMIPTANASWPSRFAFPLWSTVLICWWFVCFFRSPALIFKKNWTRNMKNKRHALTIR